MTDQLMTWWSLPVERLPRPVVDVCGDFDKPFRAVNGKAVPFGKICPRSPFIYSLKPRSHDSGRGRRILAFRYS